MTKAGEEVGMDKKGMEGMERDGKDRKGMGRYGKGWGRRLVQSWHLFGPKGAKRRDFYYVDM